MAHWKLYVRSRNGLEPITISDPPFENRYLGADANWFVVNSLGQTIGSFQTASQAIWWARLKRCKVVPSHQYLLRANDSAEIQEWRDYEAQVFR